MAKKKARNKEIQKAPVQPKIAPQPVVAPVTEDEMPDLSDPDTFRRAFIASEILNRKY
jgi:hypothetical protein